MINFRKFKSSPLLITIAVMSASVMQALDTTIVNVSLTDMQGSFSANPDQISWVLTSYLVASAIFMPLTGYLSDYFGRKNYLLICILGFTLVSVLCGMATHLSEIIIFRLLQGVFGAGLIPLSQAIMADTYPIEQRGKAMAIWGIGVMVGPIIGPSLGGYLTEFFNWRWTFYINVPAGILSFFLTWQVIPNTERKIRSMDWISLISLALAVGSTQYALDRGNQDDWFESKSITSIVILAIVSFTVYVLLSLFRKSTKSIFPVELFKDRNFVVSCFVMAAMGMGLFGTMVLQSFMMEDLFMYPAFTAGLIMAPRGLASMLSMVIVGKYAQKIDAKTFIFLGIILNFIGCYMNTFYNLNTDPAWLIGPGIIQGLGIGFVTVPLSTVALSTLPKPLMTDGAGLFSLMRTLGFSIGISSVTTLFSRHTQIAWNNLCGFLQPFRTAVISYLQTINSYPTDLKGTLILSQLLAREAQMIAIVDVYILITWSFVFMFPLLFLLKKTTYPKTLVSLE